MTSISFISYIKPQPPTAISVTPNGCISFISYIKPQPPCRSPVHRHGCISFISYIKPQLCVLTIVYLIVVYLLYPTSNHNKVRYKVFSLQLYIFYILHQTTTRWLSSCKCKCCISFISYIKPQQTVVKYFSVGVVYLLYPTSNHNHRIALLLRLYVVYLLYPTSNHNLLGIIRKAYLVVYLLYPTSNHNEMMTL